MQGWVAGQHFLLHGHGLQPMLQSVLLHDYGLTVALPAPSHTLDLLWAALAINSVCEQVTSDRLTWVGGNKTEQALLQFAKQCGADYKGVCSESAMGR